MRLNVLSMAQNAWKNLFHAFTQLFRDPERDQAQALLQETQWKELLALCHKNGLKSPPFAVFWMMAACHLDDTAEILKLIERLRGVDPKDSLLRQGKLFTKLALILETTNHAPQAAEILLVGHGKFSWSPHDTKIANRIARMIMAKHGLLSADLLLLVSEKVGWQPAEISRAEKLAKRLAAEAPEKSADLLLAIHRESGWTEPQSAEATQLVNLLTGAPQATALLAALSQNKPKTRDENAEAGTVSNFQFPSPAPGARLFVAPDQFTFEVHRDPAKLAACEQRFRNFQLGFLRTLRPKKSPPVTLVKNAYVNGLGQIWTHDGAIITKLGRKIDNLRPTQVQKLESGTSLMSSTTGIYHWLAEILPSISWTCQPGAEHVHLLTPSDMPTFKTGSLQLAGFGNEKLVQLREEACFFENLYLTWGSNSNLFFAQEFLLRLVERAQARAVRRDATKIYVSRRDSTRRTMQNEADLEKALEARGFLIVVLSEMPLADQIALFANASTIMGPHGGGLTHLMFAQPGTQVIEIVPASDQISDPSIHLRFNYARISMIKGLRYHLYLEEGHPSLPTWKANLEPILRLIDSLADGAQGEDRSEICQ